MGSSDGEVDGLTVGFNDGELLCGPEVGVLVGLLEGSVDG